MAAEAATITALVIKAFALGKEAYTQAQQISNAPRHVEAMVRDLEDFYVTLGILQGYLIDEEFCVGAIHSSNKTNLESAVKSCLWTFEKINTLVNSFKAKPGSTDISIWRKIRYLFLSAEAERLSKKLCAHKLTISMAISLANFINTNVTANRRLAEADIVAHMHVLIQRLPPILQQLDESKAQTLPNELNLSPLMKESVVEDFNFNIQRFLSRAASVISDTASNAPSMQISSLAPTVATNTRPLCAEKFLEDDYLGPDVLTRFNRVLSRFWLLLRQKVCYGLLILSKKIQAV